MVFKNSCSKYFSKPTFLKVNNIFNNWRQKLVNANESWTKEFVNGQGVICSSSVNENAPLLLTVGKSNLFVRDGLLKLCWCSFVIRDLVTSTVMLVKRGVIHVLCTRQFAVISSRILSKVGKGECGTGSWSTEMSNWVERQDWGVV